MVNVAEVVGRVVAGDRDAYAALIAEHQDMLTAYAAFRLPDPALVDEVVQQTFIRAYEQIRDFRPDGDFGVWLRSICRFMILAELQRASRDRRHRESYQGLLRRRLLDAALEREGPAEEERGDLLRRLDACLGKLQDKARALLEYRYRQALRVEEIARRLDESAGAVATSLFRIRESLRKCMEQAG